MRDTEITKEAKQLAEAHRSFDPNTTEILFFDSVRHDMIRLLEISSDVPASGCLFPVTFEPAEGMKYPSTIIVVAQEDFDKLKDSKISLPQGWGSIATAKAI